MEAVAFFAVFGLIVGGVIWAVVYLNRKRTQEFQAIAQQLKLDFFPKGTSTIQPLMQNLEFFQRGKNRKIRNLIYGKITRQHKELTVAIFDYFYTIGRQNSFSQAESKINVITQTVLLIYDPALHLPPFSLRPENLLDKLDNLMGYEDINFPEFPQFSKRYRLRSTSPAQTRELFQRSLIKFYESQKLCTEAKGSYVLMSFGSDRYSNKQSFSITGFGQQNATTHIDGCMVAIRDVKLFLDLGLRLVNLLAKAA